MRSSPRTPLVIATVAGVLAGTSAIPALADTSATAGKSATALGAANTTASAPTPAVTATWNTASTTYALEGLVDAGGTTVDPSLAATARIRLDFGDGQNTGWIPLTSAAAPISHVYDFVGIYTVTATVDDGVNPASSATTHLAVGESGYAPPTLTLDKTTVAYGQPLTATATGGAVPDGRTVSYLFTEDHPQEDAHVVTSAGGSVAAIDFNTPGTHTVGVSSCVLSNSWPLRVCSLPTVQTVTVVTSAKAQLAVTPSPGSPDVTVDLSNTKLDPGFLYDIPCTQGGFSYSVDFGDGTGIQTVGGIGLPQSQYTYSAPGTYTVHVTITESTCDGIHKYTFGTSQKVTVPGPPAPPPVSTGPAVHREFGPDRLRTGINISLQRWPNPASAHAVVLATSLNFPDALAGGPLAAKKGGPLLLTDGSAGQVDPNVLAEIQRVLPAGGPIYVLGGDGAMNPAIVAQLKRLGYAVTQFKGRDRTDTALQVARDGMGSPQHVILATGNGFADALAAGPYAAGPFADSPGNPAAIVLSDDATLDPDTRAFLAGKTVATIGVQATRAWPGAAKSFPGTDRYDTAARVAAEFTGQFAGTQVGIANAGTTTENPGYPDALTGGTFMAESNGPIILIDGVHGQIPPASAAALGNRTSNVRADIFGGPAVIPSELAAQIVALLHGTAEF